MAAPTFVAEVEGASWDTTTSPKTTAAFTAAVSDALAVFTLDEGQFTLGTPTNTGTAQTWTQQQSFGGSASAAAAKLNTAIVSAVLTAQTASNTSTGGKFNVALYQFSGSGGIGASVINTPPTTAGTISITTTGANSAVIVMAVDFAAVDGVSRTWTALNGTTPTAGNGFEKTYFRNAANYTVYGAYYPDAGAAGAHTVGVTVGTGTPALTVIAVEILGATASGPSAGPLPFPPFGPPFVEPHGLPLQLMGDRSPGTSAVSLSDIGTGTDDNLTVSATVPLADTGVGTDALSVTATVPLADTGTGTDALTVTATVPLADTGSGADALSVTATVPLADTGVGTDDNLTISATVPLSDTGAFADALVVNVTDYGPTAGPLWAPMFVQPSAASQQFLGSTDTAGQGNPSLPDTGTGTDALSVTATTSLAETGTGADALTVAPAVPLADTGSSVDALAIGSITVPLAETGIAAENLTASVTLSVLTDTGSFADVLTVQVVAPPSTAYWFVPPTQKIHYLSFKTHPLGARIGYPTGYAVLKSGGFYTQVQYPTEAQLIASDVVYLGGHQYQITQSEYNSLIAAGYGANVSVTS